MIQWTNSILKESQRSYRGALISHRHLQDINRHLHSTQNKGMYKQSKPLLNLAKPFLFYFAGVLCSQNSQEFCNVNSSKKKMEQVPSFYKMTLIDGCNPRKLYTMSYLISLILLIINEFIRKCFSILLWIWLHKFQTFTGFSKKIKFLIFCSDFHCPIQVRTK